MSDGNRGDPKDIPISAAKRIADDFWYDQVVILARRVDEPGGEHITTYGITKTHCDVAAMMGRKLKEIAGWPLPDLRQRLIVRLDELTGIDYPDHMLADIVDGLLEEMKL